MVRILETEGGGWGGGGLSLIKFLACCVSVSFILFRLLRIFYFPTEFTGELLFQYFI